MPDAAKPATNEQMEALRAAFDGTSVAFGTLIRVDGTPVTVASIQARYDADAAEIKALREAGTGLVERLETFFYEDANTTEQGINGYAGHVLPFLARLRALLEPSR